MERPAICISEKPARITRSFDILSLRACCGIRMMVGMANAIFPIMKTKSIMTFRRNLILGLLISVGGMTSIEAENSNGYAAADRRTDSPAITKSGTEKVAKSAIAGAPTILVPIPSIISPVGGCAAFKVEVAGSKPLSCQWLKNGLPIPGATQQTLVIPNIKTADAGDYHAVITNLAGSTTSNIATLTVPEQLVAPKKAIVSISVN